MMNTTSNTIVYITKNSDTAFVLMGELFGRGKRKNEFAALLADDKETHDKFIADNKFTPGEVQMIVHVYNMFNTVEPYKKR